MLYLIATDLRRDGDEARPAKTEGTLELERCAPDKNVGEGGVGDFARWSRAGHQARITRKSVGNLLWPCECFRAGSGRQPPTGTGIV